MALICALTLLASSCSLVRDHSGIAVGQATVAADRDTRVRGHRGKAVIVSVPRGGAPAGSHLTVQDQAVTPPTKAQPVAVPVGETVEVSLDSGRLTAPATLDLEWDPRRLPAGATPEDVFVASWQPSLGLWVPAPSTVEAAGHRVRVQTQHFSKWQVRSWDPGKLKGFAMDAFRRIRNTATEAVGQIAKETMRDALAVPERMACIAPEVEVATSIDDPRGGLLAACTQQASAGYELQLLNQHGIPMLFDLPAGVSDLGPANPDRPLDTWDLLLESKVHQEIPTTTLLRGRQTRAFRVSSAAASQPTTLRGNLRARVVFTDLFLYLASVVLPELKDKKGWRQLATLQQHFDAARDALDCVWGSANSVVAGTIQQNAEKFWGIWTSCFPKFLATLQQVTADSQTLLKTLATPLRALDAAMDATKVLPEYMEMLQIAGFRLTGEKEATRPASITSRPIDGDDTLWAVMRGFLGSRVDTYDTYWRGRVRELDNTQILFEAREADLPRLSQRLALRTTGDCPKELTGTLQELRGWLPGITSVTGYLSENGQEQVVELEVSRKQLRRFRPPRDCTLTQADGTVRIQQTTPPADLKIGDPDQLFALYREGTNASGFHESSIYLGASSGRTTLGLSAATMAEAAQRLHDLAAYTDRHLGTRFLPE